jgi:hypothetical protein
MERIAGFQQVFHFQFICNIIGQHRNSCEPISASAKLSTRGTR